jgi:hypothetical protein
MSGNPMRWVCDRDGCFNVERRPKIEVFSACFRHGINFGDVDGLVERNGHFLLLEWKGAPVAPSKGQRLLHDALLRNDRWTVVVACGDPKEMTVTSFEVRWGAQRRTGAGLEALKSQISSWFAYADRARAA